MENRILTEDGKAPPIVTLGNACKQAPRLGIKCATPFNNPFITDVATSPILIPDGLSATHTQLELDQIFSSPCEQADMFGGNASSLASMSGPRLYQSVLRSVHASTLPVDFVELGGGIADVVYVTPTTVGLISTKRMMFFDRVQDGYVRATKLIQCPPKHFGSVGDVCRPCGGEPDASVAYQIQCRSDPFETFTIVASKSVTVEDVHKGMCIFASAKNESCAADVAAAAPPQPLNMAADAADGGSEMLSIVKCMVRAAERITGRSLFRFNNIAEYTTRIVSGGQHILSATASRTLQFDNYSDASTARECGNALVKGMGGFLQCAIPQVVGARRRRRRLLSAADQGTISEQQGPSTASRASILHNPRAFVDDGAVVPPQSAAAGSINLPLIIGLVVGAFVFVGVAIFVVVYRIKKQRNKVAATAQSASVYYYTRLPTSPHVTVLKRQ